MTDSSETTYPVTFGDGIKETMIGHAKFTGISTLMLGAISGILFGISSELWAIPVVILGLVLLTFTVNLGLSILMYGVSEVLPIKPEEWIIENPRTGNWISVGGFLLADILMGGIIVWSIVANQPLMYMELESGTTVRGLWFFGTAWILTIVLLVRLIYEKRDILFTTYDTTN